MSWRLAIPSGLGSLSILLYLTPSVPASSPCLFQGTDTGKSSTSLSVCDLAPDQGNTVEASQELLALLVLKARKEAKAFLVLLVYRGFRASRVLPVLKDKPAHRERQDRKESRESRGQQVHKVKLVLKARLGRKGFKLYFLVWNSIIILMVVTVHTADSVITLQIARTAISSGSAPMRLKRI